MTAPLLIHDTFFEGLRTMTASTLKKVGTGCVVLLLLCSCANTIKGMGRDTASAVNATQNAGKSVGKAVAN